MIQTIKKAWGIPELRKKIIFTALILLIFRIGNAIPVPYVNTDLLSSYLEGMSTTVLGLYNVMSGGAFAQATVFALGVQPYINSSIIIQLLTIAIPPLERLAREGGEEGKKNFREHILGCKTILWNGPVGVFEMDKFATGSKAVAEAIAEATSKGAFSLIGGGDSVACINKFGLADKVSYVSTGGGALLEYIEGKELPGVAAIRK